MAEDAPNREHPVLAIDRREGATVIRLGGELDLYNADQVRAGLAEASEGDPGRVVVDMSEVEFLDSTALGVLIEARSTLGKDRLALASPQLETRRALEVSGLARHLPVHDTVDDALRA